VDDTVYFAAEGVTLPQLRFRVEPKYSDEARLARAEGTVVLALDVDRRGRPANIRIVRGLEWGLNQMAYDAVRRWRFRPAMQDGHPVTVRARMEVHFRLH
jgi:TonB family protein